MEEHARTFGANQIITSYYDAIINTNFAEAVSCLSDYSLFITGANGAEYQSYWETQLEENGLRFIEYNIVEERHLSEEVILFHVEGKSTTKNNELASFDEWVACFNENGTWRVNAKGVVDSLQFTNTSAQFNKVIIHFKWLVRYTNQLLLFIDIENLNDQDVLWSENDAQMAIFRFDAHNIEVRGSVHIPTRMRRDNIMIQLNGWFENYPSKIDLMNWKFAPPSYSQSMVAGENWQYFLDVPKAISETNNSKIDVIKPSKTGVGDNLFDRIFGFGFGAFWAGVFTIGIYFIGSLIGPDQIFSRRFTFIIVAIALAVVIFIQFNQIREKQYDLFLPFLGVLVISSFALIRYQPRGETVELFEYVFGYSRISENTYQLDNPTEIEIDLYRKKIGEVDFLIALDNKGRSNWLNQFFQRPLTILGTGFYQISISSELMKENIVCTGEGITWGDSVSPYYNNSEPFRCPFTLIAPPQTGDQINLEIRYVVPQLIEDSQFDNVDKSTNLTLIIE